MSARTLTPGLSLGLMLLLLALLELTWGGGYSQATHEQAPSREAPSEPAFLVEPYLQLPMPTGMTVMWETNQLMPGRVEYGLTRDLGESVETPKDSALHEVRLKDLRPSTTYFYRVSSADLTSEIFSFRTPPLPGNGEAARHWRMALYGDSRSNPAVHRKVAEQIARAKVDLIVHTGDIVLSGKVHDTWRKEFFEPLGLLARSVPWVSTIGNHEADSENYFSYVGLPGNERYFSFEYASATIICLDSNSWIAKGRDSRQYEWLQETLRQKRATPWTFVVFHHPLFSAHYNRPINTLRWDWAPLFLDPDNHVDGVLTGHDHFFARNYRMARLSDKPQPGVLFLTSAGGGAALYRTKLRDYVAHEKSVHHFVLFDFDGDHVTLTAIDLNGQEIDHYTLSKEPTPPEEFCAYEVEELRQFLRVGLAAAKPVHLPDQEAATLDTSLEVPTRFAVPVSGQLHWQVPAGWTIKKETSDFRLEPGAPLTIPLKARVAAGPFKRAPVLTITFDPGQFRNRTIEVAPFLLGGPERVTATTTQGPITVDGRLEEKSWQEAPGHALLGLPAQGGRGDWVQLLADRDWLYVGARLDDPAGRIKVKAGPAEEEGSRLVMGAEHVRVLLSDGKESRTFVLTPEQLRYQAGGADVTADDWRGVAASASGAWSAELAIPRKLFADWSRVSINVVHHHPEGKESTELHLCPTYKLGTDPDLLPDCRPAELPERYATLTTE